MKKSEVRIGSLYICNVSGKRCIVRVDKQVESISSRSKATYWIATNLRTGRDVHISSAARLQKGVSENAAQALMRIYE